MTAGFIIRRGASYVACALPTVTDKTGLRSQVRTRLRAQLQVNDFDGHVDSAPDIVVDDESGR